MPSNPQSLASHNVLLTHPPEYTDSFILMIKSIMLFGRVTDFTVQHSLRTSPHFIRDHGPGAIQDFNALDNLLCVEFPESLPPMYRHNNGVTEALEGSSVDTDLYLVHIIPHAAAITLHNPYIDFTQLDNVSAYVFLF